MTHSLRPLILLLLPLALLACRKSKVNVYEIPKEIDIPSAQIPAAETPGMPGAAGAGNSNIAQAEDGGLTWTAPTEWTAKHSSSIRKGSYTVGPDENTAADLGITAFPGDVGGDLANVNRWLNQLSQPPISEAEMPNFITTMTVGELTVRIVELTGGSPDHVHKMLGAIVPYEGSTWFFKLVGEASVVNEAKASFLAFIKTIKPSEHDHASHATPEVEAPMTDMASTAVRQTEGQGLQWQAPKHWHSQTPTAMRKATYTVKGDGGTAAELSVTAFPGDVGGEVANVNRWRGQLQMNPLSEAELAPSITRQTINGLAVTIVDITNDSVDAPQRLLGGIVPVDDATWFFKFTGPPALLEQEQAAFLSLIQSLQHP